MSIEIERRFQASALSPSTFTNLSPSIDHKIDIPSSESIKRDTLSSMEDSAPSNFFSSALEVLAFPFKVVYDLIIGFFLLIARIWGYQPAEKKIEPEQTIRDLPDNPIVVALPEDSTSEPEPEKDAPPNDWIQDADSLPTLAGPFQTDQPLPPSPVLDILGEIPTQTDLSASNNTDNHDEWMISEDYFSEDSPDIGVTLLGSKPSEETSIVPIRTPVNAIQPFQASSIAALRRGFTALENNDDQALQPHSMGVKSKIYLYLELDRFSDLADLVGRVFKKGQPGKDQSIVGNAQVKLEGRFPMNGKETVILSMTVPASSNLLIEQGDGLASTANEIELPSNLLTVPTITEIQDEEGEGSLTATATAEENSSVTPLASITPVERVNIEQETLAERQRVEEEEEVERARVAEVERLRVEQEQERLRVEQEAAVVQLRIEQEQERLRVEQEAAVVQLRIEQEQERLRVEQEAAEQLRVEQERLRVEQEAAEQLRVEQERLRVEQEAAEQLRVEQERLRVEREEAERIRVAEAEKLRAEQEKERARIAEDKKFRAEQAEKDRKIQEILRDLRREQEAAEKLTETEEVERARAQTEIAERMRSERVKAERERIEREAETLRQEKDEALKKKIGQEVSQLWENTIAAQRARDQAEQAERKSAPLSAGSKVQMEPNSGAITMLVPTRQESSTSTSSATSLASGISLGTNTSPPQERQLAIQVQKPLSSSDGEHENLVENAVVPSYSSKTPLTHSLPKRNPSPEPENQLQTQENRLIPLSKIAEEKLPEEESDSLSDSLSNSIVLIAMPEEVEKLLNETHLGCVRAIQVAEQTETLLFSKPRNYTGTENLLVYAQQIFEGEFKSSVAMIDDKIIEGSHETSQVGTLLWLGSKTYGKHLTSLVASRYGLRGNEELTIDKIREFFIGIGANLQTRHLRDLFNQLRRGEEGDLMLCGDYLSPEQIEEIRDFPGRFEDLPPYQMKWLVDAFRTVPVQKMRVPTIEACYPEGVPDDIICADNAILPKHDAAILNQLEMVKVLNICEPHLAVAEHISKELIYRDLSVGMVIPLIDADRELCYYEVAAVLEDQKDAVRSSIMSPLNRKKHSEENPPEFHLAFRGTDSLESWKLNTDPFGIGRTAFINRKSESLKLVSTVLQNEEIPFAKINVYGHSLGGALQMRMIEALTEQLVQQHEQIPVVKKIIDELTPEFYQAKEAFQTLLAEIRSSTIQQETLSGLLAVFENGKAFDQLVALFNHARDQGSFDPLALEALDRAIRKGRTFKETLELLPKSPDPCSLLERLELTQKDVESLYRTALTQLEAINRSSTAFAKIKSIYGASANAPMADARINNNFRQNLAKLQDFNPSIRIFIDYNRFVGDVVQDQGEGVFLGFDIHSPLLKIRVLLHYNEQAQARGTLVLHSSKAYTVEESRPAFTRSILDQKTSKNALNRILGGDYYWDSDKESFVDKTTQHLKWHLSTIAQTTVLAPKTLIHCGIGFAGFVKNLRFRQNAA